MKVLNIIQSNTRNIIILALMASTAGFGQLIPNLGGQRAGIAAYPFLKIGAGARGMALGETFIAIANDPSGLYWNAAGLTQFERNGVIASHMEYVADIKHEYLGGVFHLSPNDAIGLAITSLHMDEMEITTETQPFGTGRYFAFSDLAVGLSYSRKMTDQFSFGLTVKYVDETLDILHMRGVMVDLGTFYWTGLGTSRFAVVVSNFGSDVAPSGEAPLFSGGTTSSFQSFSPPTMFKIGFAMEPMQMEHQRVTTSIELNHPNDNAENIHLGIEYGWNETLFLRAGVKRTIGEPLLGRDNTGSNDFTAGFGVATPFGASVLTADFAYANYNLLGSPYVVTVGVTF